MGELTTENKKQVARVDKRKATIAKANEDLEETKTKLAEQKQKSKSINGYKCMYLISKEFI